MNEKFYSARFLTTMFIVVTYCWVVGFFTVLLSNGKIETDVFLGVFTGFSGLAGFVVKAYFDRSDRNIESIEKKEGSNGIG